MVDIPISKENDPVAVKYAQQQYRNLTRITLFSVQEIQHTYRDYLDFESQGAVDRFLMDRTRVPYKDMFDASHQSEDMPIRYPGLYEDLQMYNYVRVENYYNLGQGNSTIFYATINGLKYVNDGLTLINFTKDVFTTWRPNKTMIPIGNVPVERAHVDDFQADGKNIYQANINAEEISATTTLQTAYNDYTRFNGPDASANVAFAVWQVMKNWGADAGASPFDSFTPTRMKSPNLLYYLMVPYNIEDLSTLNFNYGSGLTMPAQGTVNDVAAAIGTNGQLVTSMQFIGGYTSEDLGFTFDYSNSTVTVTNNSLVGGIFSVSNGGNSFSAFRIDDIGNWIKTFDTGVSPYSLIRAQQEKVLQRGSSNYLIRNVKTSLEPFARIDLMDGFGGYASFDPSLINFGNPNLSLKFKRIGSLGETNKIFTGIDNYKNISPNVSQNGAESNVYYRSILLQNGVFQTEGREIPIISDTYASTNALNKNSNKMVYTNAQLAVTNNAIQNNATKQNMKMQIQVTNAQLKNNQAQEKAQRDISTGANIVENIGDKFGLNLGSNTANNLIGGVSGAIGGVAKGIAGGIGGMMLGGATGAAGGALASNQKTTSINSSQANARANQSISNAATRKTTDNNIQTSSRIANNNYENTIANFNAGQSDLKNAPDTITQQAGNVYFTFQALNHLTMFSVLTENADRIIQTDMYFTMFGYTYNKWVSSTYFINLINSRRRFNYVRVADVKLKPKNESYKIPQKDIETIELAFAQGITIWHDYENVLNYDLANNQSNLSLPLVHDASKSLVVAPQILSLLSNREDYLTIKNSTIDAVATHSEEKIS